jgi:hypothetical protein
MTCHEAVRSGTRRRSRLVRSVFVTVIALLVAQAFYSYAVQEPYPSFVFPSFSGAPDHQGPVRLLRPRFVVHFAGSDRAVEVRYQRLLEPAPGVVADAIAYTVFAPPRSDDRPRSTPGQFRLFLEQPTFTRGTRTLSATLRNPSTRAWLRSRLAQLFPGRSPRSLEISWDEHRYAVDNASNGETVTSVSRLLVPLEG